ncbi:MAG: carbohydrate ABC transporter permease [Eubacteriales bacterium]
MQKFKNWTMGSIVGKLFCFIIISFVVIISIGPFIWLLASSFMGNSDIVSGTMSYSSGFHPENYLKAFQLAPIAQYFSNSIVIGFCGTALNLLVSSMAAYVVARYNFKLRAFMSLCFASILFIPGSALLHPVYTTMTQMELDDTKLALILVYTGIGMATSFFILSSYYNTIPQSLEEAAFIDGADFFTVFFKIIVPLSLPAYVTAGILQFLTCWNDFTFAMILTTGDSARTLPIALYYFTMQFGADYGILFAATIIIAAPSIILFCFTQKYVIEGLTTGSVKG